MLTVHVAGWDGVPGALRKKPRPSTSPLGKDDSGRYLPLVSL
jgi:hypothetical protein